MAEYFTEDDASKLTDRAIELLGFIYKELSEWRSPTYTQMAHALGVRSTGYVGRLLRQLKAGGFVTESENRRVEIDKRKSREILRRSGWNL